MSGDQQRQVSPGEVQLVAAPGQQPTDIDGRFDTLVAPHSVVPFLDPPADSAFAAIIGAIDYLATGATPGPIAG